MPQGQWQPPQAGKDAPAEIQKILTKAYSSWRDKNPAERPEVKERCAKIAWGAVENAGWKKKGDKWVKTKTSQEDAKPKVEMARIKSVDELPGPAQAVWNDVYQIVVKKLKKEKVDTAIAKSRARRAATLHINRYYDHNPETGKWTKKQPEKQ